MYSAQSLLTHCFFATILLTPQKEFELEKRCIRMNLKFIILLNPEL